MWAVVPWLSGGGPAIFSKSSCPAAYLPQKRSRHDPRHPLYLNRRLFLGLDYLGLTYLIKPAFERDIGNWLLDEFRMAPACSTPFRGRGAVSCLGLR